MTEMDAQIKVESKIMARGLAKLVNLHIETVLWLEEYQIPEEVIPRIQRHHNGTVGHHGVQRTIERILRERERVGLFLQQQSSRDARQDTCRDTPRDASRDARQDTRKDRDTSRDARQDTRKDTSRDTSRDARQDTHQDTLRDTRSDSTRKLRSSRKNALSLTDKSQELETILEESIDVSFLGDVIPEDLIKPWTDMREHVKRYVKQCACCQKMTYVKVPITTHRFTVSALAPFVRINVDRIGPLPTSENGYNCIMVIINCFTLRGSRTKWRGSTRYSARYSRKHKILGEILAQGRDTQRDTRSGTRYSSRYSVRYSKKIEKIRKSKTYESSVGSWISSKELRYAADLHMRLLAPSARKFHSLFLQTCFQDEQFAPDEDSQILPFDLTDIRLAIYCVYPCRIFLPIFFPIFVFTYSFFGMVFSQ